MALIHYELIGEDASRPFSPHCWKTRLALRHKGLDADHRRVTFMQIPEIEGGATKTVPVIRDGERIVVDSFRIAEYLEETYPDRPSLFGGPGGHALSRFVEGFMGKAIAPKLIGLMVSDIHDQLDEASKPYFRESREKMLGQRLENVTTGRENRVGDFHDALAPLGVTLKNQPFLGGATPLFADHIAFGVLQFQRVASPFEAMPREGYVKDWFDRCLDLYGGEGRSVPAAA